MTKNERALGLSAIIAILVFAVIIVGRDMYLRSSRTIICDDGQRQIIDSREFTTEYWAYSWEFETTLKNENKLLAKIDPKQMQQLSESLQQSNEFRKFLVAGYNSCAITKTQYLNFGAKFQALDTLSRQINGMLEKVDLSQSDKTQVAALIKQYIVLTQQLTMKAK